MSHVLENTPHLLLVEDDPTSAAFLQLGLEALPTHVDVAATVESALRLASRHSYQLWLIDAHLPDGTGSELLSALRRQNPSVRALAHTADTNPAFHRQLIQAGFADVLVKPLDMRSLQNSIRRSLDPGHGEKNPRPDAHRLPLWDQEQALFALHGRQEHVDALRKLFLGELPDTCRIVQAASRSGDIDTLRGQLHRLQASCGFVGAARLGEAVLRLREHPLSAEALKYFMDACAALQATPASSPQS